MPSLLRVTYALISVVCLFLTLVDGGEEFTTGNDSGAAGLIIFLNSAGGATRFRAAVFSELGRDGRGKSIKGMIQVLRCAELLFILNSGGVAGKNLQGCYLF
jgi:hypothetical protein